MLSSRYCDEEGDPEARSFFVADAAELFEQLPERRRSLSEVTGSPDDAPTAVELERSRPPGARVDDPEADALTADALLELVAARGPLSASALERYADCPVKWLVDSLLNPEALEPDPEQMVRGAYADRVLEQTFATLAEETGPKRVTPETLPAAKRILLDKMEAHRGEFRLSPNQTRVRAAVRKLEFDLLRFLRWEAESDSAFEPEYLEHRFGWEDPVEVGEGVEVRGQIDRVDVWNGYALVRDYKTSKKADSYKVGSWERENRFQAALYMLAAEKTLGLEAVGGVYEPLGSNQRAPRGLLSAEVEEVGSVYKRNDRLAPEGFEQARAAARERILETARRLRAGELGCDPEHCAYDGTCSYPSICRSED